MLLYGNYQDFVSIVKYTDIDYSVYSDAAQYVVNGSSPYARETYRYTPLLAWMLTPNSTLHPSYGKILFILFDLLTAYLIIAILQRRCSTLVALRWGFLWIYNPLPIVICTRGSSESIILSLVLATIFFFQNSATTIAGIVYGLSLHFKPYTLPLCLPLYLASGKISDQKKPYWKSLFCFSYSRLLLVIGAVIGFGLPTLFFYQIYGMEFINETYLYHLTRKDVKHNFSIYFYLLYLHHTNEGILLKLVTFLPQVIVLVIISFLFPSKEHLPFTFFLQIYSFVIFNKVCTSQYFLWYLSLLPLLGPNLRMKWTHALLLIALWFFIQVSWLLPAYYLEFEGRNTFIYIWLESIAFFSGNIGILLQVIKNYSLKV